jgi:pimeloyl-ACP methyl ester carboxylesterase
MKGARFLNWIGFTFGYRYAPVGAMKWFFEREVIGRMDLTDEERLELLLSQAAKAEASTHPKDLELLKDKDFFRVSLRSSRECFAQGFAAVVEDGKLMSSDFGFRIEDIRKDLPVRLWYGSADFFVPLNHGKQIAARLGESARLRVEEETHGSIVANWEKEVLKDIVACM